MFICPVCKGRLKENKFGYACKKGHRFDAAAQGYVNLLDAKHAPKSAGDNPMMVKARTDFLSLGLYRPLAERTAAIISERLADTDSPEILDCGCGEGYYTNIYAAANPKASVYGMDLAKTGVRHGASQAREKGLSNVRYAAASCFELPFADRSADLIVCTFAPVSNAEYARVLKKGGSLIIVCPSPKHLYELKAVLYDEPYLNKPNDYQLKSFAPVDSVRLEYEAELPSQKAIADLFAMTPYYYKSPKEGTERLAKLEKLGITCGFDILIFRKK
ncbi:23S rRNA (guanine745-N1)-methyltransferase [Ruminococcus sp. YE71]|uniref:methyltransferase domain-containing protein n=1 Tax=unclassified Ruminococcus TaxID=2608920 RepID=UPI00087F0501|nr:MULTISPECIES: methyltransferase domain-containing protein [unclassified Ruminococcus]SDA24465.1 23S rRNA (guanine745-N1)-methyltransferase [Ruminococcus sp. YE78]SFW42061.1 23S rRNA (guanine745-N1)-methyltransferase [Ruminococcus sp. YE71]